MRNRTIIKVLACYLAVALFVIGVAEKSFAGFTASEVINLSPSERTASLDKIRNLLEAKIVSDRLDQLGFSKEEIQSKLDQLTDRQLHQIALKVDDLKVGGSALGVVVAVLVIAILVLLLVYLVRRV